MSDPSERLAAFAALLRRWNGTINLISRRDVPHLEGRHIADSLQLAPLIPAGIRCAIDLGSGAGFPGLVLAIATGIRFTLVEADSRKAAFLREAARITQAPAEVVCARMESLEALQTPLVTARALASLSGLMPVLHRLLSPSGVALLPRGETAEDELTDISPAWQMRVERHPSRTRPGAVILKLSDIAQKTG